VTDNAGCSKADCVNIVCNPPPPPPPCELTLSISGTNASCADSNDGSVDLTVSGGTEPYTFHWSNGKTTEDLSNLAIGTYSVTVTDVNGCIGDTSLEINGPSGLVCEGFRTQTMGGWGAVPHGNNPGTYLHANFAAAFPGGLTIGGAPCTGSKSILFTTAQAIMDFLPSAGTPSILPQDYINPVGYGNTFAGQLTALALSIGFDAYDPDFSDNSILLGDLIISNGVFAGWTVQQVFDEANRKISGCPSPYTVSRLNQVLDIINRNYRDGSSNNGFLSCPCAPEELPGIVLRGELLSEVELEVYPNPFVFETIFKFISSDNTHGTLELFDITGRLMKVIYKGEILAKEKYVFVYQMPENYEAGAYYLRLRTDKDSYSRFFIRVK
jgi:hypothetical protein